MRERNGGLRLHNDRRITVELLTVLLLPWMDALTSFRWNYFKATWSILHTNSRAWGFRMWQHLTSAGVGAPKPIISLLFMPDVSNTGIFLRSAFHSSGHPGCLVVFGPAYHNTACHYMMRNTHGLCKLFTTPTTWTEPAGGWLPMRMVGIPKQMLPCWDRMYRYWILALNPRQFIIKISLPFLDFHRPFISNRIAALEYNHLYM